uniref:Ankyrin 3 n=1 Tax=Crocodylus porosus TaxID=8502 RepID=A0A7M4EFF9_CROPO
MIRPQCWGGTATGMIRPHIGDARRQLVGYLLEKDKDWIEKSKEQHTVKTDIPRQIKRKRVIKEKVKETQSLPAAKTKKDHSDTISIFGAAAKGDLSNLEKMLKENDINAVNASYETLLHIAAANGQIAVMEYLIKKGAKLEVKDSQGKTPLHRAAEKGHDDAVKVLLQAGAYIYSLDEAAKTPLHLAAQNHHSHILNRILKEEAKRYRNQHNTALHLAVQAGAVSITSQLLSKGMNANIASQGDQTPLHIAAFHNKEALVDILINAGAKINAVTKELVTPLHIASQRGNADVAQKLLQHKANVNVKDKQSKTPLHLATELGDLSLHVPQDTVFGGHSPGAVIIHLC